jgi:hypothetical protein
VAGGEAVERTEALCRALDKPEPWRRRLGTRRRGAYAGVHSNGRHVLVRSLAPGSDPGGWEGPPAAEVRNQLDQRACYIAYQQADVLGKMCGSITMALGISQQSPRYQLSIRAWRRLTVTRVVGPILAMSLA